MAPLLLHNDALAEAKGDFPGTGAIDNATGYQIQDKATGILPCGCMPVPLPAKKVDYHLFQGVIKAEHPPIYAIRSKRNPVLPAAVQPTPVVAVATTVMVQPANWQPTAQPGHSSFADGSAKPAPKTSGGSYHYTDTAPVVAQEEKAQSSAAASDKACVRDKQIDTASLLPSPLSLAPLLSSPLSLLCYFVVMLAGRHL